MTSILIYTKALKSEEEKGKISSLTMIMQFTKITYHGYKRLSFCNSKVKRIAKSHKIADTIKIIKHGLIKLLISIM